MKEMNKEELIEYFIEQLGDNKVLGKVMSIDEIRTKLNSVIKEVKYEQEKINLFEATTTASWNPKEHIIRLGLLRTKWFKKSRENYCT